MNLRFLYLLIIVLCSGVIVKGVDARQWNANPQTLAQDYLIIQDQRSTNEIAVLFWVSPALIPDEPSGKEGRDVLSEHLMLGALHATVDSQGRFTFAKVNAPKLETISGSLIKLLDQSEVSPVATGVVTAFQKIFSNALGPMGQGLQWFVYDGSLVSSCQTGGFLVAFKGTEYDYKTPIPGC